MKGLWFTVKLAWRNMLRNKRRTVIAGTAIGLGLSALVFTDALMLGMNRHLVHSGTDTFLGEAQVHAEGFRGSLKVTNTIHDPEGVVATLEESPIVSHYTRRVMSFAMINSPANNQGVTMIGIDPATEPAMSHIDEVMREGEYLGGGGREIVIGSKLAELLEVELGDRVVLTAAQAGGDLSQALFRVSGIYHFNVKEMDRSMAFLPLDRARQILGLGDAVHEIAFTFTDEAYARDETLPLWNELSAGGNEAVGWPDLLPQLSAAMQLSDFSLVIVAIILFAVVSLGIINTLFMSLYERMFEFGVLRAIGTRPTAVFRLVLSEAGALSLISIAIGIVLSVIFLVLVGNTGIDYTGIDYAGVTFREKIYPVAKMVQFFKYPLSVFLITTFVGLYPAIYAARLTPARAMRKSF